MSRTFPAVIDSTMVNDFRRCPTRWAERYINLLELPGESVDLKFGGCFARGLEVARKNYYMQGRSDAESVSLGLQAAARDWGYFDEPQGHAKCFDTLMLAIDGYFKQWPLGFAPIPYLSGNTGDSVEYSFAIPLLGTKHPDTGAEIIYGGRFDMLGKDGDLIYPVDEKTTGRSFFNWASGWNLWGQFIGYQWACQLRGLPVRQLLVRGIYVSKTEFKYIQHFVSSTQVVIDRWLEDLVLTVEQMIAMYQRQYFPRVYGTACKMYKPCEYLDLCEATRREDWLSMYKEAQQWNPLLRTGGEL